MEGMYVETSVTRKTGPIQQLKIVGIGILALIVFVVAIKFTKFIGIFIGMAAVFGFYQAWLRLNVEYEYVFCDGQIDFDAIYNGSKRKNLLKIDLENAEKMAVFDDEEILRYSKVDKVKKFTSGQSDARPYALIIKKGGMTMKILFEPSELMLDKIKMKIPRKLKLDKKIELNKDGN